MAQNPVPQWLDKPFLEAALQGGEKKEPKVTVEAFSAVLATAPGDNYTSQIFRVEVTHRTGTQEKQTTTLIVKALLAQFSHKDAEPVVYNRVLSRMEEKINHAFAPKSYFCKQQKVLILSDLKKSGYVVCDKFKQLNYDHCLTVFKTLGKFHATSVALHIENPNEIENLGKETIYSEGSFFIEMMKPILKLSLGIVAKTLKEVRDGELIFQFLLRRQETLFESLKIICTPKKNGMNVLNHGDLWLNNMLFKHSDTGEVEDVKFIDYQALRYMSPAIDILYFTWTSADEDVRENRLPELYDVYVQTLNHFLRQLGCEQRYTTEELWQDMRAAVDFALATILFNFPLMTSEPKDALDFSEYDMNRIVANGGVDPDVQRVYNGVHYKTKGAKILMQIHKNLH